MDLEDFKNINIDKSDWQPVKFGDVVREIRETVKDPASQGINRIVGLEHIETENIHLRNWDSIANGTTFTRRFRKGQVLFGKRRAYLKKAALAEFDGICSGDIIVMEAKENLNPNLLPFLVNNDNFFDYAVKTSAGSLSPRTKFQHLAEYEFLLPPKDQQEKIAELLWAADKVIQKIFRMIYSNDKLFLSYISNFFQTLDEQKENVKLCDLCEVNSGNTAPQEEIYFKDGNFPFIRMQHLNHLAENKFVAKWDLINERAIEEKRMKLFKRGSILLPKSGESIKTEKKAILRYDAYVVNHLAILHNYTPRVLSDYLFLYFLNYRLSNLISQTTTPSISLSDLKKLNIPLVRVKLQEQFIEKANLIFDVSAGLNKQLTSTINLYKNIQQNIWVNL